jgi:hypothetical protein
VFVVVLLGLLVCLGGTVVGLALGGVLMLEGYLPASPGGEATATITRVPTPVPTTRVVPTNTPAPPLPADTATPPTATISATPHATDLDTLWQGELTDTPAATPTDTLTPIGAPAQTPSPAPTDTLTPIGAPARPTAPTED